jgi:two-component system chemotaxis sensor kinase CheA
MLVRCGSLTAHEFAVAQQRQKSSPALLRQVRAQEPTGQQRDGKIEESQSIRVDAQKLDDLINLVGELITAGASASLAARRSANAEVQEANSYLASLVEQVRDSALQLRMVKIGGAFSRFRRVVHDVARELGKNIELSLKGEDTELDKTVVEKIGDPLTHLVRNAMDHGIETAQVRTACGKPAHGTVTLNAFHDSGSIVIEVSDDGGGLHRDKIMAKALERGLVEPGRALTDSEIYGLIFEPGFSTAEAVTNLSGRGVGMDVVKRNIVALRGNVDVTSEVGVGTTVTLRLPLTLAIINGFQVTVGKSVFVVPLEMIDECIAYTAQSASDFLDLRGQVMPLIRLREHLGVAGSGSGRQNIVVVRHAGQRYGLVVDSLLGEAQTVIKPMAKMFSIVQGISGSSILGNGDVALIIDVPSLINLAAQQQTAHVQRRETASTTPALAGN